MKNNLHVLLGATVADAAARPLHWVYNQKKLLTYIKGKKDFTFLKNNKIFLQIEVRYENYEKIKNYLYDIGYHIVEDKPPNTAGGYTDCFFKNY